MKIYVLGCDEISISDVGDAEGPGEAVTDGTGPFPAVTVRPVHRGCNSAGSPSWRGGNAELSKQTSQSRL